jgi:molecular chaperone HscA
VLVKPSYGLADADIERMLRESLTHAKEDVSARALAENRVDGQRLLDATRSAIAADGQLLSQEEGKAIESAIAKLDQALSGSDPRVIRQAIEALNRATDEFAGRRMDAGIRRALAGKKIGSL